MDLESHVQEAEIARQQQLANYTALKQKIISTDLLIRRYNAKCLEYEAQTRRLEEMGRLVEQLNRDCKRYETNLTKALQELEPMKQANQEKELNQRILEDQLQTWQNRAEAAERLNVQYAEKLNQDKEELQKDLDQNSKVGELQMEKNKVEQMATKVKEEVHSLQKQLSKEQQRLYKLEQKNQRLLNSAVSYGVMLLQKGLLPYKQKHLFLKLKNKLECGADISSVDESETESVADMETKLGDEEEAGAVDCEEVDLLEKILVDSGEANQEGQDHTDFNGALLDEKDHVDGGNDREFITNAEERDTSRISIPTLVNAAVIEQVTNENQKEVKNKQKTEEKITGNEGIMKTRTESRKEVDPEEEKSQSGDEKQIEDDVESILQIMKCVPSILERFDKLLSPLPPTPARNAPNEDSDGEDVFTEHIEEETGSGEEDGMAERQIRIVEPLVEYGIGTIPIDEPELGENATLELGEEDFGDNDVQAVMVTLPFSDTTAVTETKEVKAEISNDVNDSEIDMEDESGTWTKGPLLHLQSQGFEVRGSREMTLEDSPQSGTLQKSDALNSRKSENMNNKDDSEVKNIGGESLETGFIRERDEITTSFENIPAKESYLVVQKECDSRLHVLDSKAVPLSDLDLSVERDNEQSTDICGKSEAEDRNFVENYREYGSKHKGKIRGRERGQMKGPAVRRRRKRLKRLMNTSVETLSLSDSNAEAGNYSTVVSSSKKSNLHLQDVDFSNVRQRNLRIQRQVSVTDEGEAEVRKFIENEKHCVTFGIENAKEAGVSQKPGIRKVKNKINLGVNAKDKVITLSNQFREDINKNKEKEKEKNCSISESDNELNIINNSVTSVNTSLNTTADSARYSDPCDSNKKHKNQIRNSLITNEMDKETLERKSNKVISETGQLQDHNEKKSKVLKRKNKECVVVPYPLRNRLIHASACEKRKEFEINSADEKTATESFEHCMVKQVEDENGDRSFETVGNTVNTSFIIADERKNCTTCDSAYSNEDFKLKEENSCMKHFSSSNYVSENSEMDESGNANCYDQHEKKSQAITLEDSISRESQRNFKQDSVVVDPVSSEEEIDNISVSVVPRRNSNSSVRSINMSPLIHSIEDTDEDNGVNEMDTPEVLQDIFVKDESSERMYPLFSRVHREIMRNVHQKVIVSSEQKRRPSILLRCNYRKNSLPSSKQSSVCDQLSLATELKIYMDGSEGGDRELEQEKYESWSRKVSQDTLSMFDIEKNKVMEEQDLLTKTKENAKVEASEMHSVKERSRGKIDRSTGKSICGKNNASHSKHELSSEIIIENVLEDETDWACKRREREERLKENTTTRSIRMPFVISRIGKEENVRRKGKGKKNGSLNDKHHSKKVTTDNLSPQSMSLCEEAGRNRRLLQEKLICIPHAQQINEANKIRETGDLHCVSRILHVAECQCVNVSRAEQNETSHVQDVQRIDHLNEGKNSSCRYENQSHSSEVSSDISKDRISASVNNRNSIKQIQDHADHKSPVCVFDWKQKGLVKIQDPVSDKKSPVPSFFNYDDSSRKNLVVFTQVKVIKDDRLPDFSASRVGSVCNFSEAELRHGSENTRNVECDTEDMESVSWEKNFQVLQQPAGKKEDGHSITTFPREIFPYERSILTVDNNSDDERLDGTSDRVSLADCKINAINKSVRKRRIVDRNLSLQPDSDSDSRDSVLLSSTKIKGSRRKIDTSSGESDDENRMLHLEKMMPLVSPFVSPNSTTYNKEGEITPPCKIQQKGIRQKSADKAASLADYSHSLTAAEEIHGGSYKVSDSADFESNDNSNTGNSTSVLDSILDQVKKLHSVRSQHVNKEQQFVKGPNKNTNLEVQQKNKESNLRQPHLCKERKQCKQQRRKKQVVEQHGPATSRWLFGSDSEMEFGTEGTVLASEQKTSTPLVTQDECQKKRRIQVGVPASLSEASSESASSLLPEKRKEGTEMSQQSLFSFSVRKDKNVPLGSTLLTAQREASSLTHNGNITNVNREEKTNKIAVIDAMKAVNVDIFTMEGKDVESSVKTGECLPEICGKEIVKEEMDKEDPDVIAVKAAGDTEVQISRQGIALRRTGDKVTDSVSSKHFKGNGIERLHLHETSDKRTNEIQDIRPCNGEEDNLLAKQVDVAEVKRSEFVTEAPTKHKGPDKLRAPQKVIQPCQSQNEFERNTVEKSQTELERVHDTEKGISVAVRGKQRVAHQPRNPKLLSSLSSMRKYDLKIAESFNLADDYQADSKRNQHGKSKLKRLREKFSSHMVPTRSKTILSAPMRKQNIELTKSQKVNTDHSSVDAQVDCRLGEKRKTELISPLPIPPCGRKKKKSFDISEIPTAQKIADNNYSDEVFEESSHKDTPTDTSIFSSPFKTLISSQPTGTHLSSHPAELLTTSNHLTETVMSNSMAENHISSPMGEILISNPTVETATSSPTAETLTSNPVAEALTSSHTAESMIASPLTNINTLRPTVNTLSSLDTFPTDICTSAVIDTSQSPADLECQPSLDTSPSPLQKDTFVTPPSAYASNLVPHFDTPASPPCKKTLKSPLAPSFPSSPPKPSEGRSSSIVDNSAGPMIIPVSPVKCQASGRTAVCNEVVPQDWTSCLERMMPLSIPLAPSSEDCVKQSNVASKTIQKQLIKSQLQLATSSCELTTQQWNHIMDRLSQPNLVPDVMLISRNIISKVMTDTCEKLDTSNTPPAPPLTPVQQYLIALIIALEYKNDRFQNMREQILTGINFRLFSRLHRLTLDSMCRLCRFYSALSRTLGDMTRMRIFLYDLLYYYPQQAHAMIYLILSTWPDIFRSVVNEKDMTPYEQTVRFMIFNYSSEHEESKMKVIPLRDLFKKVYNCPPPDFTAKQLAIALTNKLTDSENANDRNAITMGLSLLAKNEGWEWTNNIIIRTLMWPLLQLWSQKKISDEAAASAVYTVGLVSKVYPAKSKEVLESMLESLKNLLHHRERVPVMIQVAAIESVLLFGDHFSQQISEILNDWRPSFTIPHDLQDKILTFIRGKGKCFCQKLVKHKSRKLE